MEQTSYISQPFQELLERTASSAPAPGGGAVAAMTAASAAALVEMVTNLTIGKKGCEEMQDEMKHVRHHAQEIHQECLKGIDADAAAFEEVLAAMHLPKEHDARNERIQAALKMASRVPFELGRHAWSILGLALKSVELGNKWVISDGVIAGLNARAAMRSAFCNVKINLNSIKDETFILVMSQAMKEMEIDAAAKERRILDMYAGRNK